MFSFLAEGHQTAGSFSLIYCYFRKGGEPPAHYHRNEVETFYMLDGEINFRIGTQKINALPGDIVYKPKEVPHHFSLVTQTARALLLITPAGFENFFREFSVPAQSLDLPPIFDGELPAVRIERMLARSKELGVVWMPEF